MWEQGEQERASLTGEIQKVKATVLFGCLLEWQSGLVRLLIGYYSVVVFMGSHDGMALFDLLFNS